MSAEGVDRNRRRFLTATATVVGGAGVVAAAYPFLASWQPSARTQAAGAPVEVDLSKLEPGQKLTVEWRGKPVWIVDRTPEMLKTLDEDTDELRDPNSEDSIQPPYAKNEVRSRKAEIFVVIGICTHLGCSPKYRPEIAPADLGPDWLGGFFCPCHGSRFDLAGRVFQGVPAPTNLSVPPYRFLANSLLLVGDDGGASS